MAASSFQSNFELEDKNQYLAGFNSYHQSETVAGVIPPVLSLPQQTKSNLYIERISGSSFTAPRKDSKQTWLYRLLPSTCHEEFEALPDHPLNVSRQLPKPLDFSPEQTAWAPVKVEEDRDFLEGLQLIGGAGDPVMKSGLAYYVFTAGKSMFAEHAFSSTDGDFLLVLQQGAMDVRTEMGMMRVRPNEICVIPRGIRFNVSLPAGSVRGFAMEVYEGHFDLPELGPIGSCGLANIRDFQIPVASYETSDASTTMFVKFAGKMYRTSYRHSIFNVAGWHGTYYPFKYDLRKFNTIGSISYDHPDPSIFTVLTVPSRVPGEAVADVVVFGPRWLVMEDSFRPPYFHRNTMTEFTFLIQGGFDVNPLPPPLHGMFALSNSMAAHGPDSASHKEAISVELKPVKVPENHMGVMFESRYLIGLNRHAEAGWTRLPGKVTVTKGLKKAVL